MMAAIEKLKVETREKLGKGASRALRRDGKTPAVIYGKGQAPVHIAMDEAEFKKLRRVRGFRSRQLDIVAGKDTFRVLPRDINLHPVTDEAEHVDFLTVTDETRLNVLVPIRFENQDKSPGIKRGGTLNMIRRRLELSCLVKNIPEEIVIDLAGMQIGESVHISAVELPDGARPTITDRDFTICAVVGRRAEKEPEVEAAEGEEGEAAEGEEGETAEAGDDAKPEGGDE
jgi:large subunit ribosomal protein L25